VYNLHIGDPTPATQAARPPAKQSEAARELARRCGRGSKIMYYTYVLLSKKDNKLYVGYTIDLKNRFKKHNEGEVEATKSRLPLLLVYYEACINEDKAIKRVLVGDF
jgi:putative endonuclease